MMIYVDDEGAVGDGSTLDTEAIQRAVDRVYDSGGGTVVLSSGKLYLAGSIILRSHVELHLSPGSTLLASPRFEDFAIVQRGVVQMDEPDSEHSQVPTASFIFAENEDDISISGRGKIDGNGRSYIAAFGEAIHDAVPERVFTIHFRDVRRVSISDVLVVDGSSWTLRLSRCDDVVVHAITIDNDLRMPNSDGIDIDACARVRVSNCDIRAGDDAICLKASIESTRDGRVCEDVVITGCTLVSSSTAVLCGVECDTSIRNVVISDCVVSSSNRGLAVSLHERGSVERIRFENIVVNTKMFDDRWWGHGEPIYVSAVARSATVGTVSDVTFRGITARSPRGAFIFGDGVGSVQHIDLIDVNLMLEASASGNAHMADIRPVPAGGLFEDPICVVRIHGASSVTIRSLTARWPDGLIAPGADLIDATQSRDLAASNVRGDAVRI